MKRIMSLIPPKNDELAIRSRQPFFRDAIAITPTFPVQSPDHAQIAIFSQMPKWVQKLMAIRNRLVNYLGFDVGQINTPPKSNSLSVGDAVGFMQVILKNEEEIISYAEDKHLAFYLSIKMVHNKIVISTLVNKKTFVGRCYVNFIIPFHYVIARAVISNALKKNRI